ncbi:hypothetical protein BDW02DRAFT_571966 [Decorospora gaudefroyi]|uniref:Transmembrane protein n=1 Tax=Decorospora gaudefroyi TaxID=184978 RepID=A0A6A5KAN4_9PLEO|nr:hypothetical protein BDW02DRAFT_571966 [Decorospora gaudefroyi]
MISTTVVESKDQDRYMLDTSPSPQLHLLQSLPPNPTHKKSCTYFSQRVPTSKKKFNSEPIIFIRRPHSTNPETFCSKNPYFFFVPVAAASLADGWGLVWYVLRGGMGRGDLGVSSGWRVSGRE